MPQLKTL